MTMKELAERVARAIAGHFGPDFDQLPKDRAEARSLVRQGADFNGNDKTSVMGLIPFRHVSLALCGALMLVLGAAPARALGYVAAGVLDEYEPVRVKLSISDEVVERLGIAHRYDEGLDSASFDVTEPIAEARNEHENWVYGLASECRRKTLFAERGFIRFVRQSGEHSLSKFFDPALPALEDRESRVAPDVERYDVRPLDMNEPSERYHVRCGRIAVINALHLHLKKKMALGADPHVAKDNSEPQPRSVGVMRRVSAVSGDSDRAIVQKQSANEAHRSKDADHKLPERNPGRGLLGREIAVIMLAGIASLIFSGCALYEAGKPGAVKSKVGYFAAAVLFGGIGAICVLSGLAL